MSNQCAREFQGTSRVGTAWHTHTHTHTTHTRGLALIQTHYRGSWVEIVEVGMVVSGIIKEGAVLSWEGIQYCGTPGFKVCVCCECVCDVFLPRTQVLDFFNSFKLCIQCICAILQLFAPDTVLYTVHTVHTQTHTQQANRALSPLGAN